MILYAYLGASPGGPNFMYTGAGAQVPGSIMKGRLSRGTPGTDGRVSFGATPNAHSPELADGMSDIR